MEREVYLYKITNPKGSIYIGQTVNPRKRFIVYARNDTRAQHKLKNSIQKYGWENHKCELITTVPEVQANYAEKYLIAWYDSTNSKTGLNITHGGTIKMTPEMIKKRADKMIGRKQPESQRINRGLSLRGNQNAKGSIRSLELRKKASLQMKGIKRPTISKPVISYLPNGEFIKEYSSLLLTVQDGFDRHSVSRVCEGIYKQHNGVVFKYKTL